MHEEWHDQMNIHFVKILGLATFILLILIFIICSVGSGRTIIVDDNGDWAEFSKIGDAIHEAEDGDVIRVYEGIYYERPFIDKSISLIGNGSETTVIDGNFSFSVVTIRADWVNFTGFHVRNSEDHWPYAGITFDSRFCHHIRITNNVISNTHYGMYISGMWDSIIEGNTCRDNAVFGISVHQVSDSVIANNSCENNEYGIRAWLSSRNVFENNTCRQNNYGIMVTDARNNTIQWNNCSNNSIYGIFIETTENFLHFSNYSLVRNNICIYNNVGIRDERSGYNYYLNNDCRFNSASGIVINAGNFSKIHNNKCIGNDAGGIWLFGARNISVTNNECRFNGQGIFLHNSNGGEISDNKCHNNSVHGIKVDYSQGVLIRDNSCVMNDDSGISGADSQLLDIRNNYCQWNRRNGLEMHHGLSHTIEDNVLELNNQAGIYLVSCDLQTVVGNKCSDNTFGILIRYWDEQELKNNNNTLEGNVFVGNNVDMREGLARSDYDDDGVTDLSWIFESEVILCCFLPITMIIVVIALVSISRSKRDIERHIRYSGTPMDRYTNVQPPPSFPPVQHIEEPSHNIEEEIMGEVEIEEELIEEELIEEELMEEELMEEELMEEELMEEELMEEELMEEEAMEVDVKDSGSEALVPEIENTAPEEIGKISSEGDAIWVSEEDDATEGDIGPVATADDKEEDDTIKVVSEEGNTAEVLQEGDVKEVRRKDTPIPKDRPAWRKIDDPIEPHAIKKEETETFAHSSELDHTQGGDAGGDREAGGKVTPEEENTETASGWKKISKDVEVRKDKESG